MQLTFDDDVESFRSEFSAFLDDNLPTEADTFDRPRSVSHMPTWATEVATPTVRQRLVTARSASRIRGTQRNRTSAIRPSR